MLLANQMVVYLHLSFTFLFFFKVFWCVLDFCWVPVILFVCNGIGMLFIFLSNQIFSLIVMFIWLECIATCMLV